MANLGPCFTFPLALESLGDSSELGRAMADAFKEAG